MDTELKPIRQIIASLRGQIPAENIYTDELRTLAWGTDAGEYRLTP